MTTKTTQPKAPRCKVCRRPLTNRLFGAIQIGPTCAKGLSDEDIMRISRQLEPVQLEIDFRERGES